MYVGIACATALMMISFPPIDYSLPFQLASLCLIFFFFLNSKHLLFLSPNEGWEAQIPCVSSILHWA